MQLFWILQIVNQWWRVRQNINKSEEKEVLQQSKYLTLTILKENEKPDNPHFNVRIKYKHFEFKMTTCSWQNTFDSHAFHWQNTCYAARNDQSILYLLAQTNGAKSSLEEDFSARGMRRTSPHRLLIKSYVQQCWLINRSSLINLYKVDPRSLTTRNIFPSNNILCR